MSFIPILVTMIHSRAALRAATPFRSTRYKHPTARTPAPVYTLNIHGCSAKSELVEPFALLLCLQLRVAPCIPQSRALVTYLINSLRCCYRLPAQRTRCPYKLGGARFTNTTMPTRH